LGLFGFKDFLRENVAKSIETCKQAGVRTRILTGDNKRTAIEIGKQAGILSDNNALILEGSEFQALTGGIVCLSCRVKVCECERDLNDAIRKQKKLRIDTIANPKEFDRIIPYLDIMARCSPEDKYSLVVGLRERGRIVAVTGDGSNDAPAMKMANISFSMGKSG
jgi:P-type Ca2+ transporter type 2B